MGANQPYHGRTAMTNQDAAIMGMREIERQGPGGGGSSGRPPLTPKQRRSRRLFRAIRLVVFSVIAYGFVYGGQKDIATGQYDPTGSFFVAGVFGFLAFLDLLRLLFNKALISSRN